MICDGSRFSCLTLSKTTVWVYWWKGNAKIKHKLGRVCSKKTFSALLYNFSAMLFKVEELNVPMYSVDMAECPAQPRLPCYWSMFFFLKVFWTLTKGQWKAMTDSHTNSQVLYEKGRWVCMQAKEHTHLLNVSGGAGILGRGERSCQAFWLNLRGNCDFLLQRTRSRINTHKTKHMQLYRPFSSNFQLAPDLHHILW